MSLIISITSYGLRLNTLLPKVIDSIFRQKDIKEFRIIVYLTKEDYANLQYNNNSLVEYKIVPDYKSYKKYIALTEEVFNNDLIWIIDDDLYYNSDSYNLFNQSFKNDKNVYTFGLQHIKKKPFFYNDFEHQNNVLTDNYLIYSGTGCFFPPNVARFNIKVLEEGLKISPTNDDAFMSAYLISQKISAVGIKINKRVFCEIKKPFVEKTLIDENIKNFDSQILKCFNYFNIKLLS